MKHFLPILIFSIFCTTIVAQKVQVILQGSDTDTSFYHLTKINDNEFWVGGGHGMIKKVDSLGNISPLRFTNDDINILKIEKINKYIFILTDNAVIYRYNTEDKTFLKKEFPEYKNKCFYDVVVTKDGNLLVCGGASGISKGEKIIPHGFISLVSENLTTMTTVWKCYRKFVWSLLVLENGTVMAATFNGFNTKIIKSENSINWKTDSKIKGLVHEIAYINKDIFYSGTKNIRYKENGIFGLKDKPQIEFKNSGCLWSMESINDNIIAGSQSGSLQIINKNTFETKELSIPNAYSIYDLQKISDSKILMVGHGRTMYIVDFKN